MPPLAEAFAGLDDPRTPYLVRHRLDDILVLTLCATICGADTFTAVEHFGHAKRPWLARFLALPGGIPSHDTIGRLFAALDPEQFEACFLDWMHLVHERTEGEVVAIDGKTLRRSYDRASERAAVQMVSAWACANHLVLGQVAVEDGRHEATALPELLVRLDLSGCIVTLDAAGCHADVAEQVTAGGADYVLALKGNQPTLHADVEALFARAEREGRFRRRIAGLLHAAEEADGGHGRVEVRRCWALDVEETGLLDAPGWPQLRSVCVVEGERHVGERHVGEAVAVERRYYLSSLPARSAADAGRLLRAVRSHWEIENRVHWVLDVAFREDESRVRVGQAAANLSVVRRLALNALRCETSVKAGVATKRLRAGWDENYLTRVLQQVGSMR